MVNIYIPKQRDIILINCNPQSGKEQAGLRPALVISGYAYNKTAGLAILCPITSKIKGYPFEVNLRNEMKTQGVILSDHVKSLDYSTRNAQFIESIDKETMEEVLEKLNLLLTLE
jgi:mRNA interferase MazF